jgi:hypothetical protein
LFFIVEGMLMIWRMMMVVVMAIIAPGSRHAIVGRRV